MRLMAIDYGNKRCGIAVSDPLQIIATGLVTVETKEIYNFLTDYISKESVETIVIGKPYRLDHSMNDVYSNISRFIAELKKRFSIDIYEIDERFTSKMAQQSIIDSGLKKKKRQDKSLVDMVSATIILQNYMELKSNMKL